MASFSTLFLLVVLPALFATALCVCNRDYCYNMLTIIGRDDNIICISAKDAVDCAKRTLDNNPDCRSIKDEIDPVVARVKKLIQLYCEETRNSTTVTLAVRDVRVCDYMPCYQKFDLAGTDDQFRNSTNEAAKCGDTTLKNNSECEKVEKDIQAVVARAKKIIQCYGDGETGNSSSVKLATSNDSVCNHTNCYQKCNLTGTDDQFCNSINEAAKCAETTLEKNSQCERTQKDIQDVVARAKKIIQWYDDGAGNSVSVSALTLCFGLVLAIYFSRSK